MSEKKTVKIPTIPYFKFESKEHAEEWCLSDECSKHRAMLYDLKKQVEEIIPLDNSWGGGMVCPNKKDSECALDYLECEIDRIERTRDFFKGLPPRGAFNMVAMETPEKFTWYWWWDDHGLKQAVGRIKGDGWTRTTIYLI